MPTKKLTTAQQQLVMDHINIPRAYAWRQMKKRHLQPEVFADLQNSLYLNLCQAARQFNPDNGCKFSTYAVQWIRGGVIDFFTKYSKESAWIHNGYEQLPTISIPAPDIDHKDFLDFLDRDLQRAGVPIKQRQAILWDISGRKVKQLAELIHVRDNTLDMRRKVGLKRYKNWLITMAQKKPPKAGG